MLGDYATLSSFQQTSCWVNHQVASQNTKLPQSPFCALLELTAILETSCTKAGGQYEKLDATNVGDTTIKLVNTYQNKVPVTVMYRLGITKCDICHIVARSSEGTKIGYAYNDSLCKYSHATLSFVRDSG